MSIVATFAVMYLLDYSLDNLSLMALTLCIGFVVDDTIVMLENIGRHMEMGKPAMRAAFEGAKEVEFTIIAMTVSLVAVFIPVLFMGGIVGRLLQEFAVTIGVAILVSGFVSVSLTPMLCSRFLKTSHGKKHGALYNFTERLFDASLRGYDVSRCRIRIRPSSIAWLPALKRRCARFPASKMSTATAPQQSADSDCARSQSDRGARSDGQSGGDGALQRVRHPSGFADLCRE